MEESEEKNTLIEEINNLPTKDCKDILELLTGINQNESFTQVNKLLQFFYEN